MGVLQRVNSPEDVKRLTIEECSELAQEIRQTIIDTVSQQGGHLASNLGVVELTIALHRAFDSPKDKLVFDVGHQVYAHKLMTGRRDRFHTLRSFGGLSGFSCCAESEHDLFNMGHSSTSISMALGLARARDLSGEDHHVVAVVGDGALTGGMCYEALNDAGNGNTRLIVILNDNEMSISKNVGAISNYFKHLRASASWYGSKKRIRSRMELIPLLGKPMAHAIENLKDMVKSVTMGGELFEALGFRYWGPFDGHNIAELEHVLEEAKRVRDMPLLIHVITRKGNGYDLAERQPEKFHGIAPFRVEDGMQRSKKGSISAARVAGNALCHLASVDDSVVAITAAMSGGTGLDGFAHSFPDRFFDVGIAEQHAVGLASGLARGGYRPFFAVYATFLQRAYDQMIHDVCMQNLPVCFLVDHAGLSGSDGKTHHGLFTFQMASSMPGMTILAPRDTEEIERMIRFAHTLEGPSIIMYPKEGILPYAVDLDQAAGDVPHWNTLRRGSGCALFAYGRMACQALHIAEILHARGIEAEVIDCCVLKPMDMQCLARIFAQGIPSYTLEEGQQIGGFGSELTRTCVQQGWTPPRAIFGFDDEFVPHGSIEQLFETSQLSPLQISDRIEMLQKEDHHG